MIKATKQLLNKLNLENKTLIKITSIEQINFSENFLQIILLTEEDTILTPQVEKLLQVFEENHFIENFRKMYLQPAIEQSLAAFTLPDKPTSSKQQYYLTEKAVFIKYNE